MTKVQINPKFDYLSDCIYRIPTHDYEVEKVFCNSRNTVELVIFHGEQFVVKRYKRPTLANCVIYTWFRKPKPRQAYENAFLLSNLGIETAEPVAYIESFKHGIFHTGWFIARYLPYKSAKEVYNSLTSTYIRKRFATDFFKFVSNLFREHITNKDFNAGNILAYATPKGYNFAMIDINRLKKSKISLSDETRALDQLGLNNNENFIVLSHFANLSDKSFDDIALSFMVNRKIGKAKKGIKHRLKEILYKN